MSQKLSRNKVRKLKHFRIRKKLKNVAPRIVVFKSLRQVEVQLIDNLTNKVLAYSSSLKLELKNGGNLEAAKQVGLDIGTKIAKLKLKKVIFDRSGYLYHGKVKAIADAIRQKGVKI